MKFEINIKSCIESVRFYKKTIFSPNLIRIPPQLFFTEYCPVSSVEPNFKRKLFFIKSNEFNTTFYADFKSHVRFS